LTTQQIAEDKYYVNRAVEVSIHIALVILLMTTCFVILRPFLLLIAWGVIIAISVHPLYRRLRLALHGRGVLSSVLITVVLLALLICPVILLAGTLVEGMQTLTAFLKEEIPKIPPPPASIESWPVIGVPLKNAWSLVSTNLSAALRSFTPQIKAVASGLLSASLGIGFTVLQFALSIVVAGFLLANDSGAAGAAHSFARRIFGDRGSEFERLASSTIRSVTTGILGVALIQSLLAAVGFLVAGLPAAGVWAIMFLVAAVLQVGALVLIPAVIYMFMISSVTKAVIFLVWCLIVALLDNVLKPLLLGRGVAVPIVVVFLGAIGGFIALGLIGLFLGAIVLSVGYELFIAWVHRAPATIQEG